MKIESMIRTGESRNRFRCRYLRSVLKRYGILMSPAGLIEPNMIDKETVLNNGLYKYDDEHQLYLIKVPNDCAEYFEDQNWNCDYMFIFKLTIKNANKLKVLGADTIKSTETFVKQLNIVKKLSIDCETYSAGDVYLLNSILSGEKIDIAEFEPDDPDGDIYDTINNNGPDNITGLAYEYYVNSEDPHCWMLFRDSGYTDRENDIVMELWHSDNFICSTFRSIYSWEARKITGLYTNETYGHTIVK